MEEEWKDIVGFEGYYQISNLGRLKSLPKMYQGKYRGEYIMKLFNDKQGYLYTMLNITKTRKRKHVLIHRLVAIAFIINNENKREVNHIDGVKNNNIVSNLEWNTRSENQVHAFKLGLDKPKIGSLNGKSILTENNVEFIKENIKIISIKKLAEMFGVSKSTINNIKYKKSWLHI